MSKQGKKRINVYELDRRYGGPEEGGWWYDAGNPVLTISIAQTDGQGDMLPRTANAIRDMLADTLYPNKKQRYSMAPRGIDYQVVIEDAPPRPWPDTKPHYE